MSGEAGSALPEGRVAMLFTDVQGSTALLHQLGEAYGEVLDEHDRTLRYQDAEARIAADPVTAALTLSAADQVGSSPEVDLVLLGKVRRASEQRAGSPDVDQEIGGAQDEACLRAWQVFSRAERVCARCRP